MNMPRFVLVALLLLSFSVPVAGQSTEFFPLESVKPGQVGVGRTIFQGTEIEEFGVEILGVLKNIGPKHDLILARLTGEQVEKTGVFGGMSGSPVFIEGKLVGAVSYAFPYSKEPIAGITPIRQMTDIFEEKPRAGVRLSQKRSPQQIYQATSVAGLAQQFQPVETAATFHAPEWGGSQKLAPIATPLSLSGFTPQALQYFAPQFQSLGLTPVQGLGNGKADDYKDVPLQGGSTVTVQLIRGDMDASAAGTATYVNGDQIYAFGHPFMGVGYTDMPLTKGAVLTVISSIASSNKVTASTDFIGSIKQDRATGIMGVTGQKPRMIPIQINLRTSRNEDKQFNYEVVTDSFLTPFLTTLTVFNSITSSERSLGGQTLEVRCRISVKDQPDVNFQNSVSDLANTSVFAALAASAPVNFLLNSGFDELEMERVVVDITAVEQTREAVLEKVWIDKVDVRAGEEVNLTVFLRKANGETLAETYPVKVPEEVSPGPLNIMVGEGLSLAKNDSDADSESFVPDNLQQLIRAINNLKKNDRLYIRLFRAKPGAVVGGEGLPDLPPSMLELYGSKRTAGSAKPINKAVYMEYELPATGFVLEGHQVVEINIKD